MPSRVLQVLDHVLIPVESLTLTRLDGWIILDFVVDVDEKQAYRIEPFYGRFTECSRSRCSLP